MSGRASRWWLEIDAKERCEIAKVDEVCLERPVIWGKLTPPPLHNGHPSSPGQRNTNIHNMRDLELSSAKQISMSTGFRNTAIGTSGR